MIRSYWQLHSKIKLKQLVLDRPPKVKDPTKVHSTRTTTAVVVVVVRAQRRSRVDGPDSDLFKFFEIDAAVAVLVVFGEQRTHFEVWGEKSGSASGVHTVHTVEQYLFLLCCPTHPSIKTDSTLPACIG